MSLDNYNHELVSDLYKNLLKRRRLGKGSVVLDFWTELKSEYENQVGSISLSPNQLRSQFLRTNQKIRTAKNPPKIALMGPSCGRNLVKPEECCMPDCIRHHKKSIRNRKRSYVEYQKEYATYQENQTQLLELADLEYKKMNMIEID
jgi:hypothetical protein